jgi:hypothetical protein
MGQWAYQILQGKSYGVMMISAYQVCKRPTNEHGMAAFHQQQVSLHRKGRLDTNPRRNFQRDLRKFIHQRKELGDRICLTGDFNESMDDHNSQMLSLAINCNLTDPWQHFNPFHPDFATYSRSTKRIDYALVSHEILPSIQAIGYLPFHYLSSTDHRSFFIDFDTAKLFGNHKITLANESNRNFSSRDPRSVAVYLDAVWNHASSNNLFDKTSKLLAQDRVDASSLETIDSIIQQSCELADKSCETFPKPWWSQRLNQQWLSLTLLNRTKSCITNNLSTEGIQQMADEVGIYFEIPKTIAKCTSAIQTAKLELDDTIQHSHQVRDEEYEERIGLSDEMDDETKTR